MVLAARVEEEPSAPPFGEATEAFDQLRQYLCSSEARKMSESNLERELDRRGRELMRKLLKAHLGIRSPGETTGPVRDAEGVERPERRDHERNLETIFGTVQVRRTGYAAEGCESLHPLDAALNLPTDLYSLEVRRRIAEATASRSFEEAQLDLSRHTGAEVPKRQAEELAARAAQDFDAFYEARRAASAEAKEREGSVLVLSFDGKGVVMRREDLREATRKAAEGKDRRLKLLDRPTKGEKRNSKRMATVAAVYTVAPFVRTPEEFLQGLMPPQPHAKSKPAPIRPRPVAKRVWASLTKAPASVIAEAVAEAGRRDPGDSKSWVVLVDGAEHQLDLTEDGIEAHLTQATVIVDFIHVAEYVWKAAHAFHGNSDMERPDLEYWAWTRLREILQGKASKVAGAMRRAATIAGFSAAHRKPVDTCADYLVKYADYMQYDRYLASGFPICTGVIEGACRYLVRDRMELTGARWRLKSAEAVRKLRALRASGDFDEYWTFHEAREYERNHTSRYAEGRVPDVIDPPDPDPRPRIRRVK